MYTMPIYPFGKLNFKAAMLMPILLLSMFTIFPLAANQIVPNIAKISPALVEKITEGSTSINVLIETYTNTYKDCCRHRKAWWHGKLSIQIHQRISRSPYAGQSSGTHVILMLRKSI